MKTLAQAREERLDRELDKLIADRMEAKGVKLASVGPAARVKLRNVLKKYAQKDTPFRAFVQDNLARFGPGRTEVLAAALKAALETTIKSSPKMAKLNSAQLADVVVDADVMLALDAISGIDLQEIFLEARAFEEHGTTEASSLLGISGKAELERWGVGQIALAEVEEASV